MEQITTYLLSDHEHIDSALQSATRHGGFDVGHYDIFRARLLRHIAIEEKILFPAVPEIANDNRRLKVEHAALASLLVGHPDAALATEIATLMAAHNAAEEGPAGIYALYERALGQTRSCALGERARAYPAVKTSRYADGPRVHRTAASALAAARHLAARQPLSG